MTKKKSEMTQEEAERVRALAAAWREKNRARINSMQNSKRAAARAMTAPSAEEVALLRAERAAKRAAYKREWAQTNAEHVRAKRRAQYEANKVIASAKATAWNRANPDRRRAIVGSYDKRNPDVRRAVKARRRARERGAEGSYTKQDVQDVLNRQCWLCVYCRETLTLGYEVDHVEPLARGGTNHPSNLQALCRTCNRRKGAKSPVAFLAEIGAPP